MNIINIKWEVEVIEENKEPVRYGNGITLTEENLKRDMWGMLGKILGKNMEESMESFLGTKTRKEKIMSQFRERERKFKEITKDLLPKEGKYANIRRR